jgi:hypothetical protein
MAVKLHRCSNLWIKITAHPCWKVQKALDAAGVDYEIVPGPVRRSKRDALVRLSGQRLYPVIEYDDGTIYRDESKAMAEKIRSGRLLGQSAPGGASPMVEDRPDHHVHG